MRRCKLCYAYTNNPKFCTRSCAATYTNSFEPKRKGKVRICQSCKCEFRTSRSHQYRLKCKDCKRPRSIESKDRTLKEIRTQLHLANQHRSSLHAVVRQYCRAWNSKLRTQCQVCNYDVHVELCHIKPISLYDDDATLGEVNHPDNLLVLCRNCHWEFDNTYLLLEHIPNRND